MTAIRWCMGPVPSVMLLASPPANDWALYETPCLQAPLAAISVMHLRGVRRYTLSLTKSFYNKTKTKTKQKRPPREAT